MSILGSPHARFRRSLEAGGLSVVLMAAAELPRLEIDDALELLVLLARDGAPPTSSVRWYSNATRANSRGMTCATAE